MTCLQSSMHSAFASMIALQDLESMHAGTWIHVMTQVRASGCLIPFQVHSRPFCAASWQACMYMTFSVLPRPLVRCLVLLLSLTFKQYSPPTHP